MLKDTKKLREIYEDIQRKIYYMVPEKWEELYLYASVIEGYDGLETGELFFYYVPKGILRKKPVSGYEIPVKFNLEEVEYLKIVDLLYDKVKELRREYKRLDPANNVWSNLTMTIKGANFKVEFDYEDLQKSEFSSFERHIIWRYNILGVTLEQCTREEKDIIKRYLTGAKVLGRKEHFEMGIYIKDIKNIIDFKTEEYDESNNVEYVASKKEVSTGKNQILIAHNDLQTNSEAEDINKTIEQPEELKDKKDGNGKYIIN